MPLLTHIIVVWSLLFRVEDNEVSLVWMVTVLVQPVGKHREEKVRWSVSLQLYYTGVHYLYIPVFASVVNNTVKTVI